MFLNFGKKEPVHISIVAFSTNENVREIRNGFLKTLNTKAAGLYTYDLVNGDDNPQELHEKFLVRFGHSRMDIICTFGWNATRIVRDITLQTGLLIPMVYGGVLDPDGCGLGASRSPDVQHITGVGSSPRDYVTQVKKLLEVCPAVKRIAVLKSSYHGLKCDESLKQAVDYLRVRTIQVKVVTAQETSDIFCLINPLLDDIDVLMLARDTVIASKVEGIIDVCNEKGVILFASDEISVKRGALFGYFDPERNLGIEIGNHMLPLILDGKKPWQVSPAILPWKGGVHFNEIALSRFTTHQTQSRMRQATMG